jgi:hypothetical protein
MCESVVGRCESVVGMCESVVGMCESSARWCGSSGSESACPGFPCSVTWRVVLDVLAVVRGSRGTRGEWLSSRCERPGRTCQPVRQLLLTWLAASARLPVTIGGQCGRCVEHGRRACRGDRQRVRGETSPHASAVDAAASGTAGDASGVFRRASRVAAGAVSVDGRAAVLAGCASRMAEDAGRYADQCERPGSSCRAVAPWHSARVEATACCLGRHCSTA